jgi:hypothetical protein
VVRRLVLLALAAVIAFGLSVPSAFAWGSGGDDGNGYGTHDWVLDQAIGLVGEDASWVDVRTALLATDDPDSIPGDIGHVFHDEGLYGGVPQRVADLYYQACTAYTAGDHVEASRLLGLLSHYYSDVLNPFHTTDAATALRSYHFPYEHAVSLETDRRGENSGWVAPLARVPLVDVRAETVAAARFARGKFAALSTALKPMREIDVGQPTVNAITRQVLSRGVNDLADIVSGIPSARGLAKAPATMKLTLSRRYAKPPLMICAYATCLDAAGKPINGAAVAFQWPGPWGSVVTVMAYTGPTGVAHNWHKLDGTPPNVRSIVRAVASSSGTTVTRSTWFYRSVTLGSGSAGLRATVSNATPQRETTVTVKAIVHDSSGRAVAGAPVTFTWRFQDATVTGTAPTDSYGVARLSRNIGSCAVGYRVRVTAKALSSTGPRYASVSFVPR